MQTRNGHEYGEKIETPFRTRLGNKKLKCQSLSLYNGPINLHKIIIMLKFCHNNHNNVMYRKPKRSQQYTRLTITNKISGMSTKPCICEKDDIKKKDGVN